MKFVSFSFLFTKMLVDCVNKPFIEQLIYSLHFVVGAIEVGIATMSKLDRSNAVEVYTVGFVPSYSLPDKRPNSLDPFLHPLVTDLEKGFIEGA